MCVHPSGKDGETLQAIDEEVAVMHSFGVEAINAGAASVPGVRDVPGVPGVRDGDVPDVRDVLEVRGVSAAVLPSSEFEAPEVLDFDEGGNVFSTISDILGSSLLLQGLPREVLLSNNFFRHLTLAFVCG